MCKEIHIHITKEINDIEKEISKNAIIYVQNYDNKKINSKKNQLLKYYLSKIFLDLLKRNLFSGYICEILCMLFKIDLKVKEDGIVFKEFNDENFNSYYSVIFTKILEGNKYYINHLNDIKSVYKGKKINPYEYSQALILNRERNILLLVKYVNLF